MFFLLGVIILLITIFIAWIFKMPSAIFGGYPYLGEYKELRPVLPASDVEREQYLYIFADLSNVLRHKLFKLKSAADIHAYIRSKLRAEFDELDYSHGKQAYEAIKQQYDIEPYNKAHTIQYLNVAHTIDLLIKPPRNFIALINILLSDQKNIEYSDRTLYSMLTFWERAAAEN